MATVEVTFTPLPVHVRTARLVATAVARRSGVAESLLDEVRLAVGEACSRAVEAHLRHCPGQPIRVTLTDDDEQFEVVVTDAVPDAARVAMITCCPVRASSAAWAWCVHGDATPRVARAQVISGRTVFGQEVDWPCWPGMSSRCTSSPARCVARRTARAELS